jgi:hypothetical protein
MGDSSYAGCNLHLAWGISMWRKHTVNTPNRQAWKEKDRHPKEAVYL